MLKKKFITQKTEQRILIQSHTRIILSYVLENQNNQWMPAHGVFVSNQRKYEILISIQQILTFFKPSLSFHVQ